MTNFPQRPVQAVKYLGRTQAKRISKINREIEEFTRLLTVPVSSCCFSTALEILQTYANFGEDEAKAELKKFFKLKKLKPIEELKIQKQQLLESMPNEIAEAEKRWLNPDEDYYYQYTFYTIPGKLYKKDLNLSYKKLLAMESNEVIALLEDFEIDFSPNSSLNELIDLFIQNRVRKFEERIKTRKILTDFKSKLDEYCSLHHPDFFKSEHYSYYHTSQITLEIARKKLKALKLAAAN